LADKERESSTGDETSAEEEERDASVEDQHIDVTVEGRREMLLKRGIHLNLRVAAIET